MKNKGTFGSLIPMSRNKIGHSITVASLNRFTENPGKY